MRFKPYWQDKIKKRDNPEGRLQLQIIHWAKSQGYIIGKIKSFGLKNRFDIYMWRGLPDLLMFTPKLYFVEIKIHPNKQTEEQKTFQHLCTQAGINYVLAYSLEDVEKAIKI